MFGEPGATVDFRVSDALQVLRRRMWDAVLPGPAGYFPGLLYRGTVGHGGVRQSQFRELRARHGAVGVQSVKRVQPAVSVQASRRCDSLTEVPLSRLPECCK